MLVQVEPEAQARGVDPSVDDLAQAPYRPGLGQGVCDLSQAFRVTDPGEAVALLREVDAGLDTVMIYAKLYPDTLVEGYRNAMRGLYGAVYNPDQLRDPSSDDWAAFTASCNLRDMGTHVCALPTGEHCSRGLVCLGCVHAQPKKSAAPPSGA